MLCYMCGPHARSRVPPPSSSWYFTRYFLVAFLIPLQLRPGILKGIPDNKISFMPLSCQQCPTWYYYHYHLFNHSTYFCPLYAQNDSSIPNKIQPTACLMLPWVSLGPTLATEAAPAGARSLATSVSGWTETVTVPSVASCMMGTRSLRRLHCPNTG